MVRKVSSGDDLQSCMASQRNYVSLIERIDKHIQSKDPFFSFEFFPPRTTTGAINLISRFDQMKQGGPLFCDITWHASSNFDDSETSTLGISGTALNYCGMEIMMHITCCGQKEQIENHLKKAQEIGIRNIMALRGDAVLQAGKRKYDFGYAVELVKFIREKFGDYFVISVAGYPNAHPDSMSYESDLLHLKEKVDAGANFIVTQMFFDDHRFLEFVTDCRKIGITIPVIPGIMPIQSYDSMRHIMKLSKLEVPDEIIETLKPIRDNDEAIRKFGIDHGVQLCRRLLASDLVPGLHFYTLNREVATTSILQQLGLWASSPQKSLPWPAPANHRRCSEDVRPIFWSSRPKSYVYRTQTWDEFPNGRWGNSASPAFGELKDYYLFFPHHHRPREESLNMWGPELSCVQDIWNVFYNYLSGTPNKMGFQVTRLPWNDGELSAETAQIADVLASYNKRGILTINSQPNVNGLPSEDPIFGWGESGGYVYQKAYLEFFTSKKNVNTLLETLAAFPSVNYHIINSTGSEELTNNDKHRPIAVTWGVFPGSEIIQPTVVDPDSFKVWSGEAFSLWEEEWAKLYPEESNSRKLLIDIVESYYLVNLVDNNFPKTSCLWDLLESTLCH